MLLRPQQNFTIVRQITDHTDVTTYYVQSVIRDAYTDAILATLNLTDRGSQRFSKNWQVVADPSGQGREISIVTSVYTDSGYTTKSSDYGDEENSHFIEAKELHGRGGGGVDSATIRRIFRTELQRIKDDEDSKPKEKDRPESIKMPEMRWDEVLTAINGLKTALKPKEIPPTNFTPIVGALQALESAIQDKEVTPEADLTPILQKLDEEKENNELTRAEMIEILNDLISQIPKMIESIMQKTTFAIAPTTAKMTMPQKEEESVPFDINKLTA